MTKTRWRNSINERSLWNSFMIKLTKKKGSNLKKLKRVRVSSVYLRTSKVTSRIKTPRSLRSASSPMKTDSHSPTLINA